MGHALCHTFHSVLHFLAMTHYNGINVKSNERLKSQANIFYFYDIRVLFHYGVTERYLLDSVKL